MAIWVATLVALGIGIAFCFYGYRVFLVMLPIWGFFGGLWLGAEGVALILGEGFLATATGWAAGFVVGLVMALLSYAVYYIGVGLVAFVAGVGIAVGLLSAIGIDTNLILAVAGLATGIVLVILTLMLNLQKYVVTIITAIGGANALVLAPLLLLDRVSLDELQNVGNTIKPMLADSWFWLLVWLVLAGAGVFYQLRMNRDFTFSRDRYVEGWG
jgi:hypothetical protein